MKRLAPFVAAFVCLSLVGLPLAVAAAADAAPPAKSSRTPGLEMAALATQITGIAISPLLGVSAVGAYQYFKAEEKTKLPWFANPGFWGLGLLIVAAAALKDAAGATLPPGWKKPLDVAETVENKISGLVAAGAVLPSLVAIGTKVIMESSGLGAVELHGTGLAMLPVAAFDASWLLNLVMVPLSIAVFGVVWLASHAINGLILLSPWGGVDAALKGARTALLGIVTATAWIDPVVGATLSLVIVVVAYFIAGWAFRLTVFGWLFSWDFLTLRRTRYEVLADGNRLFTGRAIGGVPVRTYGRLRQDPDGRLVLKFRPWLVLPEREVELPRAGLVVGKGVFYSEVIGRGAGEEKLRTLLLLPPRYLGHEELFARTYHLSGTTDVGLRKAWSWLREALGFGAKKGGAAPAAA